MPSIDQRIVEMQFDNKQFNSGIQTTMSALDKLKSSLNFQGIGDAAKNTLVALDKVDLSGITSGISALQDRFSTFGIVGMQIIQNLTNTVMQFGKNLWNNTFGIIKTKGLTRATNIENAKFMLQGLIEDQDEVNKILAQASESVNDTAYGYDEAAKAAGQFAASGIESGELMEHALRGITGVAATTNSDYESISRIFTTVSGNGRLMGDQLNQLASRGLNAASTLAKELGKTEEEVRSMTSKGQISFEMFATAMDSAFGEHAKKANETFNGALSNMKAALGRIGADWYTPFLEQNSTTVKTIVSLKEALVDVKNTVTTPLANGFLPWIAGENGLISQARIKIEQFKKSIESVKDEYSERIKKVGDTLGKAFITLSSAFHGIGLLFDAVFRPIKRVFGIINDDGTKVTSTLDKVEDAVSRFSEIIQKFKEHVWSEQFNIERGGWITELAVGFRAAYSVALLAKDAISALIDRLTNSELLGIFEDLAYWIGGVTFQIENIVDQLKASEFIPTIINHIATALEVVYSFTKGLFDDINKMLNPLGRHLLNIGDIIAEVLSVTKDLMDRAEKAKTITELPKSLRAIVQIFGATKVAIELVKNAVTSFVKVFGKPILDLIKNVMDPLLDIVNDVTESFIEWGTGLIKEDAFTHLFETILGGMRSVLDFGKRVVTTIIGVFSGIYEFLSPIFTDIGAFIDGFKEGFKEKFHSPYMEGLGTAADNAIKKFHPLQAVVNAVKKAWEILGGLIEKIKPVLKAAGEAIGDFFGRVGTALVTGLKGQGWDTFMELLNGLLMIGAGTSITTFFSNLAGALKNFNLKNILDQTGITKITKSVNGVLGQVKTTLAAYTQEIKAETLMKIAQAVALLAGSLWLLSTIPTEDLAKGVGTIAALMTELVTALAVLSKYETVEQLGFTGWITGVTDSVKQFMRFQAIGTMMVKMAAAILLLAFALSMIATIPEDQLTMAVVALIGVMAALTGLMFVMSKINEDLEDFKAGSFIAIAAGILIIAMAMKTLGKIENMDQALVGLFSIMGVFAVLMIVAEYLQVIDSKFGQGQLPETMKRIGGAMFAISAGILIVAAALKIMSTISAEQMMVALVGLTASLAMMTLVIYGLAQLADKSDFEVKFGAIAGALVLVSNSLMIFAIALKLLSSIGLEQMCVALIGMGAALGAIGLFFYVMSNYADPKDIMVTAAAMTVMAAALILLTIPLKIFSKMSLEEICKALLMLVGTLLAVSVVAVLMATWAPTIMAFSASLLVLGVAMLTISTAIFLFSAAIASLAVSGPLGVAALGALIVEIVAFIPLLLAGFLKAVNESLTVIFQIIQTVVEYVVGLILELLFVYLPDVLDGLGQLFSQVCDWLILHIPEFFAVLGVLVNELADFLVETGIPRAVEVVGTLISEVLTYVKDHIEDWAYDLCVIISGAFDGLAKGVPMLVDSIGGFLIDVLNAVGDWLYDNADSVADALLNVVEGVFYAAATLASKIFTKITDFLYDTFVKPIKEFFGINSPSTLMAEIGENIIQGLFNGITGLIDILTAPVQAIIDLFQGLIDKAGDVGEAAYDALHGPITGEYTGELKEQDDDARKRAQTAFETGDTSQLEGNDKANYYYLQLKNQGDFYNELYPTGYNNGQALIDGTKDALADGAAGIGEEGKKAVWSYADTMQAHLEDAKKAGKDVSDASLMAVKNAKIHYGEAGAEHAISYADTMKSHVQEAKRSGTLIASGASTAVNSKSSEFKTAGSNSGTWFSRGISSTRSSVETAAKAVAEAGIAKIQDTKDRFKDTGKYLLLGLKEGLEDREYIQAIRNAAGNVSYVAADEMRKAGVIQSPSKVTMQIGRYFLEGLAIGLSENDIVAESAQDTAQTVLSTLSGAFDKVEEFSDGLTVSPSITPVLDMNNVDTGLLSSMLSANRTMTMSGNLQVNDSRSQFALLNALNNLEKNGNRDVVTALNVLSGNVAQYTDAVRNMRIIMDSGTLVGEIGEAMDYRLGSIDNYRQRGMM